MRKIIIMMLFPLSGIAQGIHFEEKLTWQQVLAKAKEEHKNIFVDCFATWCGPCKMMSQDVFRQDQVGELVNTNFISTSIQMDSTKQDDEFVRSRYQEVRIWASDYHIASYPTYLFFDSNGQILHRATGAMSSQAFIDLVHEALKPDEQFYPLLKKYQSGSRDSTILRKLVTTSFGAGDGELTNRLMSDYLIGVKDDYCKDNLQLIGQLTKTSKDPGFKIWLDHTSQVDKVMGKDYAERKAMNIIMSEDSNVMAANKKAIDGLKMIGVFGNQPVYDVVEGSRPKQQSAPNWHKIYVGINTKYGSYYADRITRWNKMNYFKQRQIWSKYNQSILDYVSKYRNTINSTQLNGYGWDIFSHSNNVNMLAAASSWLKEIVNEKEPDSFAYMDTYANLLYKRGYKTNAIIWEKRATQFAPNDYKQSFKETLQKMQAGKKTWK